MTDFKTLLRALAEGGVGRPKDFEAIAELEAIREERTRENPGRP